MTLMPFPKPEPTDEDQAQAKKEADALIKKFGMMNVKTMLAYLVLENVLLVRECNFHRAARDMEPLPTFKV